MQAVVQFTHWEIGWTEWRPSLVCLKTAADTRLIVPKKVSISVSSAMITEPEITPHGAGLHHGITHQMHFSSTWASYQQYNQYKMHKIGRRVSQYLYSRLQIRTSWDSRSSEAISSVKMFSPKPAFSERKKTSQSSVK